MVRQCSLLIGNLVLFLLLSGPPAAALPPASIPHAGSPSLAPRIPPTVSAIPTRVTSTDLSRRLETQLLNMFVTNRGSWATNTPMGAAGLVYPRGTSKTALYSSGLWIGAQEGAGIHLSGSTYSFGYAAGPIMGGVPSPDDPSFIVYKVRGYSGNPEDTAFVARSAAELAADPGLDSLAHHGWSQYLAGAAPYGAPVRTWRLPDTTTPDPGDSVDVLGPDVRGDLMTWCVYNDGELEVQQTAFAFDSTRGSGDQVFIKFEIINKGSSFLENTYVGLWSDPDLGSSTDDVTGCDVGRQLGYAYNGQPSDLVYGTAPPAAGFVLLRGPKGAGGDPLGLAAFTRWDNGSGPDEPNYDFLRGLGITDPTTGQPTTYSVSGDPVTGLGWLDDHPADRRMLSSTGPFTMSPGDTQVVVAALMVAQGDNQLGSVAQLQCQADAVRGAWAGGLRSAPIIPSCPLPRSCPLTASRWAEQCGVGGFLDVSQLTSIAQCVSGQDSILTWPTGQELAGFCGLVNPSGAQDLRARAKREFAALVANVCSGRLRVHTSLGDSIYLNPLLTASCPPLGSKTIGQLLPRVRFETGLADARYLDNNAANPPPLVGVNAQLEGFGGGAGTGRNFLGSSLDPTAMPDSFVTVELRFDHSTTQQAYRYLRLERAFDGGIPPQGRAYLYGGFRTVPFTAWDVDHDQQLEVGFAERVVTDDGGTILSSAKQPATFDSTWSPDQSSHGGREFVFVFRRPYAGTPQPLFARDGAVLDLAPQTPVMYALWARLASDTSRIDDGDAFRFVWGRLASPGLDSLFIALENQPLSDPGVQEAYTSLLQCLKPINDLTGVSAVCDQPTATLVSLVSADAEPGRVSLVWFASSPRLDADVERREPHGDWSRVGRVATDGTGRMAFEDRTVLPGHRYGYRLLLSSSPPNQVTEETWVDVPEHWSLTLHGLRPNPTYRGGLVSFALPYRAPATIQLFDIVGRRIWARDVGELGAGQHLVPLAPGRQLAPGIYMLRLTQGRTVAEKKAVLLK